MTFPKTQRRIARIASRMLGVHVDAGDCYHGRRCIDLGRSFWWPCGWWVVSDNDPHTFFLIKVDNRKRPESVVRQSVGKGAL